MEMTSGNSRNLAEIPWNAHSIPAVRLEELAEWNTMAGSLQAVKGITATC